MIPSASLDEAAALVCRKTGLTFSGMRASALESGLLRAMRAAEVRDPADYVARLDREMGLLDALVAEITIGETHFFRDRGQWDLLRGEILPPLLERRSRDRPLRMWSAGCASGEEPYSMAILLHEMGAGENGHVVGTDLSRKALAAARRGVYTRWSLRGVSDATQERYFRRTGQQFELLPALRERVEFRYHNLAADAFPSVSAGLMAMDVVLCRNVLIYFDAGSLPRVAQRLLDSLSEDGWLLLGASDPPIGAMVECEVHVTSCGLAYRRRRATSSPSITTGTDDRAQPPEPVRVARVPRPTVTPSTSPSRARKLDPRHAEDVSRLVVRIRCLANSGDLLGAGRACSAALELHRGSAELAYLHALLLLESGHPAEAATAARLALYLDRNLAVGHLLLGGALARAGERAAACRAVRNAQRLLDAMKPDEIVPASDGETAARLAQMARVQLELLEGVSN